MSAGVHPMKRLRALSLFPNLSVWCSRNGRHPVFYVDWRLTEPGNRWRLQVSTAPLWTPLGHPRPTRHSTHRWPFFWAFWARGNE